MNKRFIIFSLFLGLLFSLYSLGFEIFSFSFSLGAGYYLFEHGGIVFEKIVETGIYDSNLGVIFILITFVIDVIIIVPTFVWILVKLIFGTFCFNPAGVRCFSDILVNTTSFLISLISWTFIFYLLFSNFKVYVLHNKKK